MQMLMFLSLLSTGCLLVSSAVVDPYGDQSGIGGTGHQDHNIGQTVNGQIAVPQNRKDDLQSGIQAGSGVNQGPVVGDVLPDQQVTGQESGISGRRRDRNDETRNINGKNEGIRKGDGLENNKGGRRSQRKENDRDNRRIQRKENDRDSRRVQGKINNKRNRKDDGLRRKGGNRRNDAVLNKDKQNNNQQAVIQ